MRKLFAAALLAASAIAAPASSAVLHYTLQGVTFDDGGTFTGSFDFETANSSLVDYNLQASATDTFGANSYVLGSVPPGYYAALDNAIAAYSDLAQSSVFYIYTVANLSNGGTIAINTVSTASFEGTFAARRQIIAGSVTTDAVDVPEPAMLGMFGLGAIGLGLSRRRKTA